MRYLTICFFVSIFGFTACSFDSQSHVKIVDDGGNIIADGKPKADASKPVSPDGPSGCITGEQICVNNRLSTCNSDGSSRTETDCVLACVEENASRAYCTVPSNVPNASVLCAGQYKALKILSSTTKAVFNYSSSPAKIVCAPNCGEGSTTEIISVGPDSNPIFCLSELTINNSAKLYSKNSISSPPLILIVEGAVKIEGEINVSGGNAKEGNVGTGGGGWGSAGPGGSAGAALNAMIDPNNGFGPGAGHGGRTDDSLEGGPENYVGGGGGGGGYGGGGGGGQIGKSSSNSSNIAGGMGGLSNGSSSLIPLSGGSGGGSGGDGKCGQACGWAGGGGGGAIQISARDEIVVSGEIIASGGNGYGTLDTALSAGGGGGGGSGGGILLEAPRIQLQGSNLLVEGGNGGGSSSSSGGQGATRANFDGARGTALNSEGEGGVGGGGGGGRIRLNAINFGNGFSCSAHVSPEDACSQDTLTKQPILSLPLVGQ